MTGLPPRVVAVVVAWNRRELVVETLAALAAQTVPLHDVVVIDNASTDGSADIIRARFPEVALTTLPTNTGALAGSPRASSARCRPTTPSWCG